MLSNVERLHTELRNELSCITIPDTKCPLFNSMRLTICNDVHRNALLHLCNESPLFVCPVAIIVLRRFKKQLQMLNNGDTLRAATPTKSDLQWESNMRKRIATINLSNTHENVVLKSIHDMLQNEVHICAMFEVCRRFCIARPFVDQKLTEYCNQLGSHGHDLGI